MNSKSFRSIHGNKQKSSSTAFISLHFNKADEEQLEISYGEKKDPEAQPANKNEETQPSSSTGNKMVSKDVECELENPVEISSTSLAESEQDEIVFMKNKPDSREATPTRDSVVKEYWSRISKRASSVDSDIGITDKSQESTEGWKFFKDVKGKLTKTLEERKSKDPFTRSSFKESNVMKGSETNVSKNLFEENTNILDHTQINYENELSDSTPTDSQCGDIERNFKLSPAIEASEVVNEDTMFENYIESELQKAKCEIVSSKSTTSKQFTLNSKKTTSKKSSFNMTLSSLMANRNPSVETAVEEAENLPDKNAEALCTNVEDAADQNSSTDQRPEIPSKDIFYKLSLVIRRWSCFIKSYWNSVIFRIFIVIFASLLVSVPSWLKGFLIGTVLSGYLVYLLFKPGKAREKIFIPNFNQPLSSNIPITEVEDEPIIFKGWMNELLYDLSYDPDTYHINCTRSLYIRLDGSYLRLSYPQNNIPRRAMFNESRYDKQFIHQHHYDITGASIELLPEGLARKRLWSKKYPICLRISNPKQAVLSNVLKDISDENASAKSTGRKESPLKKFIPRINENNEVVIYLFSRTDREKDLWYHRFKKASKLKLLKSHSPSSSPNIAGLDTTSLENKRTKSIDLSSLQLCSNYDADVSFDKESDEIDSFTDLSMTKQQKFEMYMSHLMSPLHFDPLFSYTSVIKDRKESTNKASKSTLSPNSLKWLNVLIGRIFFDFLSEDIWTQLVAERIQRKLSKIKLPAFLSELSVKDINLGTALPKIHRASEPSIDQRGLWVDIDLSYNGSFQMTLQTKINLLRYKRDSDGLSLNDLASENTENRIRSPVYNSEEDDSAESSSDEDIPLPDVNESSTTDDSSSQAAGGSTGKKILRFVDRLAQSTYFQHAAKNKYIKKAMEDISNTPLVLTVEVQWLAGTLALNIPPMPTDRLWYGFRTNPHLSIVARPKLGQHAVTFTHVTEWIEKKLVSEFQKVLVMPNMDDLMIPIMQSDQELPKA